MRTFYWGIYLGIICFLKGFIFLSLSILIPSLYICYVQESPMQKGNVGRTNTVTCMRTCPPGRTTCWGSRVHTSLTLLPVFISSITNTEVCSLAVVQEGKSLELFRLATSVQWKDNSTSTSISRLFQAHRQLLWGGVVPYHGNVQYLPQPRAQTEVLQ